MSLSPSESEDPRSHSGSVAGDTTEGESSQGENDRPSPRGRGTTLGNIEEDARQDWNTGEILGKEVEIAQQPDVSGNYDMIAFQRIAE